MSCADHTNTLKDTTDNLTQPAGATLYDDQTAGRMAYMENPINIVEGFGFSWNNILLIGVVALLIIAFVLLVKDFSKQAGGELYIDGLGSPSVLELTAITGIDNTSSIF